jgi:hypothetical protein
LVPTEAAPRISLSHCIAKPTIVLPVCWRHYCSIEHCRANANARSVRIVSVQRSAAR